MMLYEPRSQTIFMLKPVLVLENQTKTPLTQLELTWLVEKSWEELRRAKYNIPTNNHILSTSLNVS